MSNLDASARLVEFMSQVFQILPAVYRAFSAPKSEQDAEFDAVRNLVFECRELVTRENNLKPLPEVSSEDHARFVQASKAMVASFDGNAENFDQSLDDDRKMRHSLQPAPLITIINDLWLRTESTAILLVQKKDGEEERMRLKYLKTHLESLERTLFKLHEKAKNFFRD